VVDGARGGITSGATTSRIREPKLPRQSQARFAPGKCAQVGWGVFGTGPGWQWRPPIPLRAGAGRSAARYSVKQPRDAPLEGIKEAAALGWSRSLETRACQPLGNRPRIEAPALGRSQRSPDRGDQVVADLAEGLLVDHADGLWDKARISRPPLAIDRCADGPLLRDERSSQSELRSRRQDLLER
jgi:hypothetical protein